MIFSSNNQSLFVFNAQFIPVYSHVKKRNMKKVPAEAPIDVTHVSHSVQKDVEYFQQNLSRTDSNQVCNYTWEKASDESPSFYKPHEIVYDKEDLSAKSHKNTLDLMSTTKGHVHGFKHNQWENETNSPPVLHKEKPSRHGVHLSSMTQYAEEINRTFPGHTLY